jgi:hypothetical protein
MSTTEPTRPDDLERVVGNDPDAASVHEADRRNGEPDAAGAFGEEQSPPSDTVVEAVGRASEALEYVERARGHLYSFHQLIGRADILFGEAGDLFIEAGAGDVADDLVGELVGRNVLDGRWTFQVVEEFDELYHRPAVEAVQRLEARFQSGRRHVYEARMKEQRRSARRPGHERRPPASHDDRIETDGASDGR